MAGNGGIIGPINTVTNGCEACATAPGVWQMNTVYDFVKNSNWVYNFRTQNYMVVGGGGSGGAKFAGVGPGGGGAGGYRASGYGPSPLRGSAIVQKAGSSFAITIGAGGAAPTCRTGPCGPGQCGQIGNNSIYNPGGVEGTNMMSSNGGGGGGKANSDGMAGASGGGSGGVRPCGGGAGNTPPTSPPQGNRGGHAIDNAGAGGGGAGAVGGSTPAGPIAGNGGVGVCNAITGSGTFYAGGGGGGNQSPGAPSPPHPLGTGGNGGGGTSTANCTSPTAYPKAGQVNSGGGGGAGVGQPSPPNNDTDGGQGGSGIVIVRSAAPLTVAPGTNTTAACGACTVATFTVTGTLTIG